MSVPGSPAARTHVTVAVLTYRRTGPLARLLPMVVDQARECTTDARTVRVLVVDNDEFGSAADVVAEAAEAARAQGVELVGVVEESPGISAARNRALAESAAGDLLAFIDDDETPEPGWLRHLLATQEAYDCAAVAGPVPSVFDAEPSAFIAGGGFFGGRTGTTGEEMEEVGTGNLLLDLRRLRRHGITFDPGYGITGGEDTKLCHDLRDAGERIIWCQEAVCLEPVTPERATEAWVRQRTVRLGTGWARVRLEDAAPGAQRAKVRAGFVARGAAKAARGGVQTAVARARRDECARGRAVREALGGVGILSAALGVQVQEYRRPTPLSRDRDLLVPPGGGPRPVTVGVPTFRRPEGLATVLAALAPQVAALAAAGREAGIVVVDNSPEAGARAAVEAAGPAAGITVRYVHEPRPGLAAVRNAAIAHATPDGYLAMVDDDAEPAPDWLEHLVACADRTAAAAVAGQIRYRLPAGTSAWVARSGHFDTVVQSTDQELAAGATTGNLLLDLRQLRIAGLRFDEAYGLTGGEDSRLMRDLRLAGGKVVGCAAAVVEEDVPADRATREWVLSRAERNAESWARVRVDVRPGESARVPAARRPAYALRGALRTGRAMAGAGLARVRRDEDALAQAQKEIAVGRGIVRGALGVAREEYARRS